MNQVVGKVVTVSGKGKAVAPDGTCRVLMENSPILAFERIVTKRNASVSIVLDGPSPTQLDIGAMSDIIIDEDVFADAAPEEVADATAEAEQIRKALLQGEGKIGLEGNSRRWRRQYRRPSSSAGDLAFPHQDLQ